VFPMRYELDFYIPEDGILHSDRRENLKSYIALTGGALNRPCNVFSVRYDLGFISQKSPPGKPQSFHCNCVDSVHGQENAWRLVQPPR
jgi:hypothetical protein